MKNNSLFEALFITEGTMCVISPDADRKCVLLRCFHGTLQNRIKPNLNVASFF